MYRSINKENLEIEHFRVESIEGVISKMFS